MRFYLSKADEAGHESDRQRVMMQIVQELCKRPTLNRTGFDMPTIFIPNPDKPTRCVNQLERDCNEIGALVDSTVDNDNAARAYNLRASSKGFLLLFIGCTLPVALALNLLFSS